MKKIMIVDVPEGYQFTHKTMEIHNPTIPHLGATQYPEFTEITPPMEEEIDRWVNELAKLSTAPDKDTPDWMKRDIRNGIELTLKRLGL